MASIAEIMQLCRLCLVKEQVNVPIFEEQGDIRQIFLKITACLPVKISREDNLPKKICNGCLYKLELLYQFWNTSTNAEKQLLSWLTAAGLDATTQTTQDAMAVVTQTQVVLKQEPNPEITENVTVVSDPGNFILQAAQQPIEFPAVDFDYQDNFTAEQELANNAISADVDDSTESEPVAKRPRRTATATVTAPLIESEDDADDPGEAAVAAKTEEDSDDDTNVEPTFVDVAEDQDGEQPGPSGLGKIVEPSFEEIVIDQEDDEDDINTSYQCEVCSQIFPDKREFLEHHVSKFGSTFTCCRCNMGFRNTTDLYQHYQIHKLENESDEVIFTEEVVEEEPVELHYENVDTVMNIHENVEAVMNIPDDEGITSTNELLYILEDDSQCVNEVVIEEDEQRKAQFTQSKPDNYTIVQVDHGYIIPSVFKGQLEPKRRYKKRDSQGEAMEEDEDTQATNLLLKMEPSTSKFVYSQPRPRMPQPKRRHELPDFSATNYEILPPTPEVDMAHFKCLRCEQLFISKFTFFRHIEKGKCYINSCDVCTATFNKNSEFYDHYVIEHTERAICNFCFRTFMYEKNVKEHMLRHLDQFRHRCEECNKGFYTVREYRNHYKNRHMGIRHKCEECGRSFADEYYFKRHIATHGMKPPIQIL